MKTIYYFAAAVYEIFHLKQIFKFSSIDILC